MRGTIQDIGSSKIQVNLMLLLLECKFTTNCTRNTLIYIEAYLFTNSRP